MNKTVSFGGFVQKFLRDYEDVSGFMGWDRAPDVLTTSSDSIPAVAEQALQETWYVIDDYLAGVLHWAKTKVAGGEDQYQPLTDFLISTSSYKDNDYHVYKEMLEKFGELLEDYSEPQIDVIHGLLEPALEDLVSSAQDHRPVSDFSLDQNESDFISYIEGLAYRELNKAYVDFSAASRYIRKALGVEDYDDGKYWSEYLDLVADGSAGLWWDQMTSESSRFDLEWYQEVFSSVYYSPEEAEEVITAAFNRAAAEEEEEG